jgi:hypothetical protein
MGLDPTRKYVRRRGDYFLVAAALAVCVALVVWGLVG